jgi:hypothetical protein
VSGRLSSEYKYVSILRCRTWCIWPSFSRFISKGFAVPVADSSDPVHLSIHLVSYEPRPRPELAPTRPSEPGVGPIVWRGQMSTGYWVGPVFLKAPEDTAKVEFEHEAPHQGEMDIQLHVAASFEVSKAELKDIATSISYSTLSYINIALGELLVPVAPIQIRRLSGERESQFPHRPAYYAPRHANMFSDELLPTCLVEDRLFGRAQDFPRGARLRACHT